MAAKTLHLTNGGSFTQRLSSLLPRADILTWNEILCEGPASKDVLSEGFILERISYLGRFGDEAASKYQVFVGQFSDLDWNDFDEVVFWFEYDLFCHINMAAAITYVSKELPKAAFYLVCSGTIEGKEGLYGLSELPDAQVWNEYDAKIRLTEEDLQNLSQFWDVYTSQDHSQLDKITFNKDHFPYFASCIQAHKERFPQENSGLNTLELTVLKAIDTHSFESSHKLVGHLLKNQGYYGFGDLQWFDIVERVAPYYDPSPLSLNPEGKAVLQGENSAFSIMEDPTLFGQCPKYNYLYNPSTQALEKR